MRSCPQSGHAARSDHIRDRFRKNDYYRIDSIECRRTKLDARCLFVCYQI